MASSLLLGDDVDAARSRRAPPAASGSGAAPCRTSRMSKTERPCSRSVAAAVDRHRHLVLARAGDAPERHVAAHAVAALGCAGGLHRVEVAADRREPPGVDAPLQLAVLQRVARAQLLDGELEVGRGRATVGSTRPPPSTSSSSHPSQPVGLGADGVEARGGVDDHPRPRRVDAVPGHRVYISRSGGSAGGRAAALRTTRPDDHGRTTATTSLRDRHQRSSRLVHTGWPQLGASSSRTSSTTASTTADASATTGLRPMPSSSTAGSQPTTSTRPTLAAEAGEQAEHGGGAHRVGVEHRRRRGRSAGSTSSDGHGARRLAHRQGVDQHEHVVAVEQLVGEVDAADAVLAHASTPVGHGRGRPREAAGDLDAEAVVAEEHVADAGHEDPHRAPPRRGRSSRSGPVRRRSSAAGSSSSVTARCSLAVHVVEHAGHGGRLAGEEQVVGVGPRGWGAAPPGVPRPTGRPADRRRCR